MLLFKRRISIRTLFFLQYVVFFVVLLAIYKFCYCGFESTPETCESWLLNSPKLSRTYLATFVVTSLKNFKRRDTIRETWLKLAQQQRLFYRFVVGTENAKDEDLRKIRQENDRYGDLLLFSDLEDSYSKLTDKVLSSFIWFTKNVEFEFILKLDDDSFVQYDQLVEALKNIKEPKKSRLYWGFMDGRAPVQRTGKWAETDWILCDRYLPHALGGGYVLSRQLSIYLASNAHLLNLYKSEDVAVGAWLAGLDVLYLHDTRFDTEWKSRGCFNDFLITHKQSESDMRTKYNNLKALGKLCGDKEVRLRYSYLYDWDVLPSQCCKRDTNGTLS